MSAVAGETGSTGGKPTDPLAALHFGALVSGAARLRPERIAFLNVADPMQSVTFGMLEQRVGAAAQGWRKLGLAAGERILIVATASAATLVALLGALRAGLDAALAAPHLSAEDLGRYARAVGAACLASEAFCGDVDIGEAMFQAAAQAERVRIVAALGATKIDGAAALDPLAADADCNVASDCGRHALVITRDGNGECHFHRQRTLVASALDFVTRVQIGTQIPLVSAILPASFAGLAAGPAAALIAGAPLVLHAPFDAAAFFEICNELRPVHLIAPATLGGEIASSGLPRGGALASLVLLARYRDMPAEISVAPPDGVMQADLPVFDLYGVGEIAAFAERRLLSGGRVTPLATQHMLSLDGGEVLAARRKLHYLATNGRLDTVVAIEGAAVSQAGEADHV